MTRPLAMSNSSAGPAVAGEITTAAAVTIETSLRACICYLLTPAPGSYAALLRRRLGTSLADHANVHATWHERRAQRDLVGSVRQSEHRYGSLSVNAEQHAGGPVAQVH